MSGSVLEEGLRALWEAAGAAATGAGAAAGGEREAGAGKIPGPAFEEVLGLLTNYIEEIARFNPAYGLVKVRDRRELAIKHILDSLAPLGILAPLLAPRNGAPCSLADAGSGAGLPGIPLAVCLPGVRVTLLERMGRRAGFLRNTAAVLGLSNVTVEEGELEKAPPGRFRGVVFRALKPLAPPGGAKSVLRGLCRLLEPEEGAFLGAYKGRSGAVEAEMALVLSSGALPSGFSWESLPVKTPFLDEERRLLLIRR